MKPLPHQESPIKKALEYLADPSRKKPEIIVAPTASGKSVIIASISNRYQEPVLVLQPSQELLEQNIEKLFMLGGQATIYSASLNTKKLSNLTYATLGSVKKDVKRLAAMGVKTVLIDECFSGDTLISLPDYSCRSMKELYKLQSKNKKLPVVNSYNETTKKFESKKIVRVKYNGVKQLYLVRFANGGSVRVTDNHELLTQSGWKQVKDLTTDDLVILNLDTKELYGTAFISRELDSTEDVYDLEIEDNHNYVVSLFKGKLGIVAHNCHFKFSPEPGSEFSLFMDALKPTKVIGLTATPFRLKGGMEGSELKLLNRMRPNYFKGFIDIIQIKDIIANGYWSKLVYETYTFDEKMLTVNTSGSDFTDESVKRVIKDLKINNHIYLRIKELLAEGCPSILVFADSVESCITFCEHLPDAAYLAATMKKSERTRIVRDFKAGKIKVLFNFGILTTGFDYPDLRCVIMGRPTMSLALYYQIIGRGTRISPATGKESCLYIDYCNNVERFGMIENLTLDHIEGWGWGMFNGEILLTNVLINGLRVTKQELRDKAAGKNKKIDRIWFGAHTGKLLTELPIHYIEWLLEKSGWEFTAPKMAAFKKQLLDILEDNKTKTFIKPN